MRKKIKNIQTIVSLFLKRKFHHIFTYIYAFTLIELIVVISVISILWLIAYSSFTTYIRESRDATRFYNLNTIDTNLQVFQTEIWRYPDPINWVNITYSGSTLWTQWSINDDMVRILRKLNKKPVDVYSLSDFSYSLSFDKTEYELWAVIEWESNMYSLINDSYAKWWDIKARSMVVWNYNWKAVKSFTGWVFYIIALPTIITYELTDTDIVKIIEDEKLSYKWYWNIPATYTGSVFQLDGWFSFKPNILAIYEWSLSEIQNNENEWLKLLKNFQNAYSGSIFATHEDFIDFLNTPVDLLNPSKEAREIAYSLANEQIKVNSPIELKSWSGWLTYVSKALLDSDTRAISQDHLNNLWFATKNWVSMFDNNTWWTYLEKDWLVDKDVRDLVEDVNGNMWFATNKWVSKFDGTTFTNYSKTDWLLDNDVVWVVIDQNWKLWFATKKWVATLSGSTWWKYEMKDWLIDKVLTWIAQDTAWNMWFTTNRWISKFNWTTWTNYTEAQWLIDKNVISVYADTNWNVWFGTYNWISKYNGSTFTNYTITDWLVDNFVQTIYQDHDGDMWFGTLKWASKFDGSSWKTITEAHWLADNDVQVIFQDNADNMWFGTKMWVTIYFEDL